MQHDPCVPRPLRRLVEMPPRLNSPCRRRFESFDNILHLASATPEEGVPTAASIAGRRRERCADAAMGERMRRECEGEMQMCEEWSSRDILDLRAGSCVRPGSGLTIICSKRQRNYLGATARGPQDIHFHPSHLFWNAGPTKCEGKETQRNVATKGVRELIF